LIETDTYAGAGPLPTRTAAVPTALRDRLRDSASPASAARQWWREHLTGIDPATSVTSLLNASFSPGTGRRAVPVPVPPSTARHLVEWTRGEHARLLTTLVVAAGVVTARYSGRTDILVSTVEFGTADEPRLLPIHLSDVEGQPVRRLLSRTGTRLKQALRTAPDLPRTNQTPLWTDLLGPQDRSAVAVCVEPVQRRPATPDLVVAGRLAAGGTVEVELDVAARVDGRIARQFAGHLARILTSMVEGTDRPARDLEILGRTELDAVLAHANHRRTSHPAEPVHTRVLSIAAADPDRTAMVFRDRRLTYAELAHAARAVAQRLDDAGVVAGDRVALFLDRGDLPGVAVLGAFLLGAVYVPIETRNPDSRIHFILDDCGANAIVTEPALVDRVPPAFAGVVITLDDSGTLAAASGPPRTGANRTAPAYAIYTSGTTGRPKAVLVEHSAFAATCAAYGPVYGIDREPPVALQLGSIAFDVFNGDLGRSWYHGGTLVVCPDDERTEVERLTDLIARERVTILESTPALINPLVDALVRRPDALSALQVLISSADAWRQQDYARARAALPDVRVFNTYGVTEASIDSTAYSPEAAELSTPYAPIGRPFPGVTAYVLDRWLRLVPPGVVGELCLAGDGLARGYLNRPALTADRFGPDPFHDGERIYHTGDLVRMDDSGHLEFLGRSDHQVQIRGFRVELGEIEHTLLRHPGIREAAVGTHPDRDGGIRLTAYIVTDGSAPNVSDLRRHCADTLPGYMIPATFVSISRLPLNPNGKLDRSALPEPENTRPETDTAYQAATTAKQQLIVDIWQDVLGIDRVGVNDNFFDLGGHSLLAIRVVARLTTALGTTVGVRTLFENPTVAALAVHTAAPSIQQAPTVPRTGQRGPRLAPIGASQRRLWFLEQWQPGTAVHNIPIVVRLRGRLDLSALSRALDAVEERHEALRTTVETVDGLPWQRIHAPNGIRLVQVDLRDQYDPATPPDRLEAVRRAVTTPFDLELGPLVRAVLVRIGDAEHILAVVVHHIVGDGWSLGIVFDELASFYGAFTNPFEMIDPPPPPLQYADVGAGRPGAPGNDLIDQQLAFWRSELTGVEPAQIPLDRPRPAKPTGVGAVVDLDLPVSLAGRVADLARQTSTTSFTVVLAAFELLLYRCCAHEQFLVGTVTAGRPHADLERVVGFFANTLPVRADVRGNPSFMELLVRVRDRLVNVLAAQDVPFDRLVAMFPEHRDPSRNPLFQVCIAMDNTGDNNVRLPGIEIVEERVEMGVSHFDLTLNLNLSETGLNGVFEYATDLFEPATIKELARSYVAILDQVVTSPQSAVSDISPAAGE
jgi:amino acid adenylation domain-containing protein